MLKAIIFDLDETLLDWRGRKVSWEVHEFNQLAQVHDYIHRQIHPLEIDTEEFFKSTLKRVFMEWNQAKKSLIAPHLGQVLMKVLVEAGVPPQKLSPDVCLQAYNYKMIEGVCAYPEVIAVLQELQTYPVHFGIITNALQPMKMRDVDMAGAGLLDFFPKAAYRLSAADVGYLKPHPAIFETLLQRMDVSAEDAVFVGDNLEADIKGAKALGLRAVWRKNDHFETFASDPSPDATITSLSELPSILDAWRKTD